MLLAVHLRHELRAHKLVKLLEAGASGHLRRETLGVREHLVDIGVAAADHLGRSFGEDVERRTLCPFGENAARILLEFAAAEVDIDDLAPI